MRMPVLQLSPDEGLFYEWESPADGGLTFVFVEAGELRSLDGRVAAPLRAAGHGTLLFRYRGEPVSPARPGRALDDAGKLADLTALLVALRPANPVLVQGGAIAGIEALRLPMLPFGPPDRLLQLAREHAT
jgi:hypothetical protein